MNALERWIYERSWTQGAEEIMNLLQEIGIISDECVNARDVAPVDAEKAVQWLDGTLAD